MKFIADLHIHSRYSIATSKNADLESYYRWAQVKGIHVLGTGDFTHPQWFKEIREKLYPDGSGFLRIKEPPPVHALEGARPRELDTRFCLSAEISSIYKKRGATRKVHSLIFAPDLETAERISTRLSTIGNIGSDGRPILGLDPKDLLAILLDISPQAFLIPAHIWTPWFSLFGSKSGFDAIEECFEELTGYIFALETGLSSDPEMNWRWSKLDGYSLVSHSDAHSPNKLGREADIFDTEFSYSGMFAALKTREGFEGTLEFHPQEGKYHMDGHRKCGIRLEPEETIALRGICPACGKKLTVGVLHRVTELADRPKGFMPTGFRPTGNPGFRHIVPLPEILSEVLGIGPTSKPVLSAYQRIVSRFGSEFSFLLEAPLEEIESRAGYLLGEAIRRLRGNRVRAVPGFDGEFGTIRVFQDGELESLRGQGELFGFDRFHGLRISVGKGPTPGHALPEGSITGSGTGTSADALPSDHASSPAPLDEKQREAVHLDSGAVLITAGPGTGKTRVLSSWIARLILEKFVPPVSVLAITFTNRAAREMAERLTALLSEKTAPLSPEAPNRDTGFLKPVPSCPVRVSTFHALCFELLTERLPGIREVFDESSRSALLELLEPAARTVDRRRTLRDLRNILEGRTAEPAPPLATLVERYRSVIRSVGGIDIADLVSRVNLLLTEDPHFLAEIRNRFRYVAVDEFQDINAAQYRFLSHLTAGDTPGRAVFVIGDPDQAIYGFRGSDLRLFFLFRDEYKPEEITLDRNYRSADTIVRASHALIARNTLRSPVAPVALQKTGLKIGVVSLATPTDEARYIAETIEALIGGTTHIAVDSLADRDSGSYSFSDLAVLTRTKSAREDLVGHLTSRGIPLNAGHGSSLSITPPFSSLFPVLRFMVNTRDVVALSQVLRDLLPGFSGSNLRNELLRWSGTAQDIVTFFRSLVESGAVTDSQFQELKGFLSFLDSLFPLLEEKGVVGVFSALWERFIQDDRTGQEERLEREDIAPIASEFGSDLHGFLRQVALSPYESQCSLRTERVSLLTFHASKGLEFPVVFIAGAEEGITPILGREYENNRELEEERRLFYVAMTRAKDRLTISYCRKRKFYGRWREAEPSRFITELPPELTDFRTPQPRSRCKSDGQLMLF